MHKVLAQFKSKAGFTFTSKSSPKRQLGFTLIELIIAIVIVVILTTIGVASFNSASKATAVQQQAQEIKTLARKLRTDASAAIKPVTGSATNNSCKTPIAGDTDAGTVYGNYIIFTSGSSNYTYGTACYQTTNTTVWLGTSNSGTMNSSITFSNNLTILYAFDGTVGSYGVATPNPPIATAFPPANTFTNPVLETITDNTHSRDYQIDFAATGLVCEEKANPAPATPCAGP